MRRDDRTALERPIFADRWTWRAPRPSELVTHEYAALGLHLQGSARVEQQSQWKLNPGDVLLVPAGQPHRLLSAQAAELWGVGFCVGCFSNSENQSLLEPFQRVRSGATPVVALPAGRQSYFALLCSELSATSRRFDPGAVAAQRSLLTLILDEIAQAAPAPSTQLPESLVGECLRVIEQRCLEPLSLEALAAAVKRSPTHVTATLRKRTGRSAHEWISAGRMAEARRRLLHSDELVEVIAERVGYLDATSFIRKFRQHHSGLTPSAWRLSQLHDPALG